MRVGAYTLTNVLDDQQREVHQARSAKGEDAIVAFFEMSEEGASGLQEDWRRCQALDHPNVAKAVELFEHQGRLVAVFEGVAGASLARVLAYLEEQGEHLSDGAALKIGMAVCQALHAAHTAKDDSGAVVQLVHAQLGPHQVFLTFDGQVRLLGLGLGMAFRTAAGCAPLPSEAQPFVAPEARSGGALTVRANVFSVGALLWMMLGRRPIPEPGKPFVSLQSLRPDLGVQLTSVIDRALETSLLKRTVTCFQLAQAIERSGGADAKELAWNLELFAELDSFAGSTIGALSFPPVKLSAVPPEAVQSLSSFPPDGEGPTGIFPPTFIGAVSPGDDLDWELDEATTPEPVAPKPKPKPAPAKPKPAPAKPKPPAAKPKPAPAKPAKPQRPAAKPAPAKPQAPAAKPAPAPARPKPPAAKSAAAKPAPAAAKPKPETPKAHKPKPPPRTVAVARQPDSTSGDEQEDAVTLPRFKAVSAEEEAAFLESSQELSVEAPQAQIEPQTQIEKKAEARQPSGTTAPHAAPPPLPAPPPPAERDASIEIQQPPLRKPPVSTLDAPASEPSGPNIALPFVVPPSAEPQQASTPSPASEQPARSRWLLSAIAVGLLFGAFLAVGIWLGRSSLFDPETVTTPATQATATPAAAPISASATAPSSSVEPPNAPASVIASVSQPQADPPLLAGQALLIVETQQQHAHVYVNGRAAGEPGAPLIVACGVKSVRIGTRPLTSWLSPSEAFDLVCRGKTVLSLEPTAGVVKHTQAP